MAEGAAVRGQVQGAATEGLTRSSGVARSRASRDRTATRTKLASRPTARPASKAAASAGKGPSDEERTLIVTHSDLRAGQKTAGRRTTTARAGAVKKAPKKAAKKKAAKKKAAKKRTRAKVPARGKRKATRRS